MCLFYFQNIVHTPLCHGNQLIGDDFFLQLAIRNLKRPIWRKQRKIYFHFNIIIRNFIQANIYFIYFCPFCL